MLISPCSSTRERESSLLAATILYPLLGFIPFISVSVQMLDEL